MALKFPAGFNIDSLALAAGGRLGIIHAPGGMSSAAVFTENCNPAWPVIYSRERLSSPGHKAVIVNKGSANAATGEEGKKRLNRLLETAASALGVPFGEILSASTGVIGRQIEISDSEVIELCSSALSGACDPEKYAEAIMTTDTHSKIFFRDLGESASLCLIAKGSGMMMPNMATMLVFIMTDAVLDKGLMQEMLSEIVSETFNCLNIDGETSTNDTVFLLSSGLSDFDTASSGNDEVFRQALYSICEEAAMTLAADGEGATKLIKLVIAGAADQGEARLAARAISSSPLCKTAFYGESPNWGRIISALGANGIAVELDRFFISINGVSWLKGGQELSENMEEVRKNMALDEYELSIELGRGAAQMRYFTCDYSLDYIKINAGYIS
jgi:glutamate N-acetyltransferase/amino-acid N-acetyltransferase